MVRTKIVLKVGKLGAKYDILTLQEEKISHIGNKIERRLEITPWQ